MSSENVATTKETTSHSQEHTSSTPAALELKKGENETKKEDEDEGEGRDKEKSDDIESLSIIVESENTMEEENSVEEDFPIEDIDHLMEGYFFSPRIYGKKVVVDPLTVESLYNVIYELGIIPLSWPVITDPHFETRTCLPESYYKNNDKERILMMFAENFRQQYRQKYPKRRPLILQASNDCGLNKMVCTTIRPTWIRFPEMRTWEGCAHFVSDYLDYEPLHKPILPPDRILSPFTVLKRQKGNSFEYATVLTSYLIGANVNAYVVIGYATREFTLGIFNRRSCPEQIKPPEPEPPVEIPVRKYKVNPGTDLRSQHLLRMEQKSKDKMAKRLEEERLKREAKTKDIETPPPDDIFGWRIHAWVLVLPPQKKGAEEEEEESEEEEEESGAAEQGTEVTATAKEEHKSNAVSGEHAAGGEETKEGKDDEHAEKTSKASDKEAGEESKYAAEENEADDEDLDDEEKEEGVGEAAAEEEEEEVEEEEEEEAVDSPFYIEPVTGTRYEINREEYLQVEAIYNHKNYYINLQDGRVPANFNIRDSKSWLLFLPEVDNEAAKKQFDMPNSWVEKLELSNNEFHERYPGGKKILRYKKVILEQYAPYSTMDGLLKRYMTFSDYSYTNPIFTHEWYDRRPDNLREVHYDYIERIITEYFKRGREDYLKEHRYEMDRHENCVKCNREIFFYHYPRFDCLQKIATTVDTMTEDFIDREDKLFYRYIEFGDFFENQELHRNVMNVTEKFHRNPNKEPAQDVAIKFFNVAISEIQIQYHYEDNFVTRSTRVFYKPNLMDTGGVLTYVPEMTAGYVANPNSPNPRQLTLFLQLVQYMQEEKDMLQNIRGAEKILGDLIHLRHLERKMSADAVLLFDADRNEEAKKGILAKMEAERQRKERELKGDYSPRSANIALRNYIKMLLKRQNTMQERYDMLVNKLKEDRVWYLTNQYTIKPQEERDYVLRREQMNFEVSTLEIRMDRQKALSKDRYEHLVALANARSVSQTSLTKLTQVEYSHSDVQTHSDKKEDHRPSIMKH